MNRHDLVDRRVLGAVRFVSQVNGLPISVPLLVTPTPAEGPAGVDVRPNRRGLHVIFLAPGFAEYTQTFLPSDLAAVTPATVDLHLRVTDPSDRYLPRDFVFRVPRDLSVVTTPLDVPIYPTLIAPLADGWAVLDVRVERELATPPVTPLQRAPVPGALVRVLRSGGGSALLGSGVTEWRQGNREPRRNVGEGLVAIPGIALTVWSTTADGNVLERDQRVRFEVRFDSQFDPVASRRSDRNLRDDPVPNLSALESFSGSAGPTQPIKSFTATGPGQFSLRARDRRQQVFLFNTDLTAVRRE